jgi:hypothetical protein
MVRGASGRKHPARINIRPSQFSEAGCILLDSDSYAVCARENSGFIIRFKDKKMALRDCRHFWNNHNFPFSDQISLVRNYNNNDNFAFYNLLLF